MEFLNSTISCVPEFKRLLESAKKGNFPIEASGLSMIHKALLLSAFIRETKQRVVLITPDEAQAFTLGEDLKALGVKAKHLPARDYTVAGEMVASKEYEHMRVDTLSGLLDGDFELLTLSCGSAMQYTISPKELKDNTLLFKEADSLILEETCQKLSAAGYVRTEQVEGKGQFAVRGGIIDIFAVNRERPCRIELWGD